MAFLPNLFILPNAEHDLYLNYYDGSHDLLFVRVSKYIFASLAIEHTACVKKNIILVLKLDYLIISYIIIPTSSDKNLVPELSILFIRYLITQKPISLYFIVKHMFVTKSTTSPTSLAYSALFTFIFDYFLVSITQGSNQNQSPNYVTKPPSPKASVNKEGFLLLAMALILMI